MESSTKEVVLRLPVFLGTLPDMLCEPFDKACTLCVIWSKTEFQLWQMHVLSCAVMCPTPRTTGLVTNFSCNIAKDSFSSNSSQFSILPHYMRLRQFAGFKLLLIPWYQIPHPSLPSSNP